ncbi:MAG: tRNA adenosine(34) deaminase TadA [Pseudomonadota bacterium]|nr:tRNA adenosine(34) deaminase TadA [Pseudomonadota bacterium]
MTEFNAVDREHMLLALAQARSAEAQGEVPVGAIIVKDDQVIASGHNRNIMHRDPSAHAEVVVIRLAAEQLNNHRLSGTTLYVTLEPCAMCMGAMLHARVERLVYGASDPKSGAAGSVIDLSAEAQFNHSIQVDGGLLEDECAQILKVFFKARR